MVHILGIAGSPTTPSRSTTVLRELLKRFEEVKFTTELISVRDLNATELMEAQWDGATIKQATAQLAHADVVIVATPVYKAAYSGVLKAFLDLFPRQALANKVILPMATGGSAMHMLALDYALNPVLSALGATIFARSLYLVDSQVAYTQDEEIETIDEKAEERIDQSVKQVVGLLDQLNKTNDILARV